MSRVLIFSAIGEFAIGVALLIAPQIVGQLLFGQDLIGVTVPVARVTGIALVALAIACWPGGRSCTRLQHARAGRIVGVGPRPTAPLTTLRLTIDPFRKSRSRCGQFALGRGHAVILMAADCLEDGKPTRPAASFRSLWYRPRSLSFRLPRKRRFLQIQGPHKTSLPEC